jgi:amphi-Trp domain-containing protein
VSDVEVKRTESLTRQQAAERLSAMATALADGGHVKVQLGASTLKLHVPDHVRCEVEVEVDGDEVELEVELKWSRAHGPESTPDSATEKPAHNRSGRRAART